MYFSAMYRLCIDYVDNARRSSARGRQKTVIWQKQVFIHTRTVARLPGVIAIGFLVMERDCLLFDYYHTNSDSDCDIRAL